jgi:ABC-type Fe3+-siderophore transport system permease subunit
MRLLTSLLFVLAVIAGFLAYKGFGTLTEPLKLTYAFLALSTLASALINLTTAFRETRQTSRQRARAVNASVNREQSSEL